MKKYLINTIWIILSVVLSFLICFYLFDDLLLEFYPVASQLIYLLMRLFIAMVLLIFTKRLFQKDKKIIDNTVLLMANLFYFIFLVAILFLGRNSTSTGINFVPFRTIISYLNNDMNDSLKISNLLGNLLLLMPLGIILKTKIKSIKLSILTGVIILFSVEIIQFIFKVGSFDIDDMILNSFGLLIGYLIYQYKQKAYK
ncbi:VanZ family protein [Gottfriedia acidiceleris]|uniref:VanZ family protein n=1 Tax=Gottfriedia acidiceleris TaxID=371036 RepID=UPI000B43E07E|nr:VanZ family protein [Gottfriedia acidiceleris]